MKDSGLTLATKKAIFRKNVAALIKCGEVYLACFRPDHGTWQTVQGGIEFSDANPEQAIIREMIEELGVTLQDFKILYQSSCWRRYHFPRAILENDHKGGHWGQDQLWFLIELKTTSSICLEKTCGEFSQIDFIPISQFLEVYSPWKKAPFYDFCREIGVIPST